MNEDSTSVELMAILIVGVIFGIGALVLFAATEGPWAWILVGVGLLAVLALVIRRMTTRHPHMWDDAPPETTAPSGNDDA
jgi:amino acid transporter